jgi:N-succinyldiaminopimelate aminotransferase
VQIAISQTDHYLTKKPAMNPDLEQLHPYPFEKLTKLRAGSSAAKNRSPIALSIGEPKQPTPHFIRESLTNHLHTLSNYPTTKGLPELRQSIAQWLCNRFSLPSTAVDPEQHILPVNGTREALFSFAQAVVDRTVQPLIVMPNPFYQIYEGAALLAGAEPYFINTTKENNYQPNYNAIPDSVWARCQLLYICTPGNPTGSVIQIETLQKLIQLAQKHNFIIASDECYSEIYPAENNPPAGLLQAADAMGNSTFEKCVVFHSLSKRSNAPGLRSGFVAGDAEVLKRYFQYRTYHGCAMSLPTQYASISGWRDEQHVLENREGYRQRFDAVLDILGNDLDVNRPDAGFYLWARTPISDTDFTLKLFQQENIAVLPGSYLSRTVEGITPGQNHIRMALVAPLDECIDAAHRISRFIGNL